jgi:hypothetical protein
MRVVGWVSRPPFRAKSFFRELRKKRRLMSAEYRRSRASDYEFHGWLSRETCRERSRFGGLPSNGIKTLPGWLRTSHRWNAWLVTRQRLAQLSRRRFNIARDFATFARCCRACPIAPGKSSRGPWVRVRAGIGSLCMTPRSQKRDLGHPLMVLDLWRWFSRRHRYSRAFQRLCGTIHLLPPNPGLRPSDCVLG